VAGQAFVQSLDFGFVTSPAVLTEHRLLARSGGQALIPQTADED
jgi:hypothetical protein